MTLQSWRGLWTFLAVYALALALLLPRLSLWLDEILALTVSIQPDLASFLEQMKVMKGATPVEFLLSGWTMALLGKTAFAGRLYSAVASVAACGGIFLLARRLGLRTPLAAVCLFALCPLQFRYAMETRPYALALCLNIWSTLAFLSLLDRPKSRSRLALYAGLQFLTAYTMVYALFASAAHLLWLVGTAVGRRVDRRVLIFCGAAVLVACVSLAPWYLMFQNDWALAEPESVTSLRAFIGVVLREITGAGYFGSLLLLSGVWGAFRGPSEGRAFYVVYSVTPLVLAPLADLAFSHFFAIRQVIFSLPPLLLLFALGAESLGRAGKVLLIAFLAAALYADVTWMTKPRENWEEAAAAASRAVADGACVVFVPPDAFRMFEYFQPQLLNRQCQPNDGGQVILAISPYDSNVVYSQVWDGLMARGYLKESEMAFNGPRVELFRNATH